jgi:hypothetical protein
MKSGEFLDWLKNRLAFQKGPCSMQYVNMYVCMYVCMYVYMYVWKPHDDYETLQSTLFWLWTECVNLVELVCPHCRHRISRNERFS